MFQQRGHTQNPQPTLLAASISANIRGQTQLLCCQTVEALDAVSWLLVSCAACVPVNSNQAQYTTH